MRAGGQQQSFAFRGLRAVTLACLAFVAASLVPAQAHACVQPRELGMAFAIDDSGSMLDSDPDELRVAATRAGIDQISDNSTVAVSSFDSYSRSQVEPTTLNPTNREAVKNAVFGSASGTTEYDLGFAEAQRQLDGMTTADKKALIFLSDGAPTDSYSIDRQLAAKGVPIFTIGFGSAPPEELQGISSRSGGTAFTVQSPAEAQAVFAKIISLLECDTAKTSVQFSLAPGETRTVPFNVDPTDREFRSLTTWSDADASVGVSLRRPNGTSLAPGNVLRGETYTAQPSYTSAGGLNPAAGVWNVNVTAGANNIGSVNVTVDVWRRDRLYVNGLGDSVAAGFGLHTGTGQNAGCLLRLPTSGCDSPSEAWPALVANQLRQAGRPSLASSNVAIAGSQASQWLRNFPPTLGTWQLLPRLNDVVAAKPDYALVTLGANDLLLKFPCMKSRRCTGAVALLIRREMAAFFKRLGSNARTITYATLYYDVALDTDGAVDQINDALRAAASKSKAKVVLVTPPDFARHGCGAGAQSWMLSPTKDGCLHPNALGQQMIATRVLQAMQGVPGVANTEPAPTVLGPLVNVVFDGYPLNRLTTRIHAFGLKRARVAYKYVYGKARRATRGKASAVAARKSKGRARVITKRVKLKQGGAVVRTNVPRAARTRGARLYVRLLGTKKCVRYKRVKGKRGRKQRKCKRYRREGATGYKLLTVIPAVPSKPVKPGNSKKKKRGAKKKRAGASAASALEENAARPSCASLTIRVDGRDTSGGVQTRGDLSCGDGVALLRNPVSAERFGWVCNRGGRKAECRRGSASVDFAAP